MNVLIIEDEAITARRLEGMLCRIDPNMRIAAILGSIRQSTEWLGANCPDLIFADIHLADGPAFEIFKQVDVSAPVIFTTAFDRYAIEAFKVNSVDYLLKPISQEKLQQAVNKYNRFFKTGASAASLGGLVSYLEKREYQKRFLVTVGQRIRTIPVEEVAYFFASEKVVFLVAADGQKYPMSQSLDAISGRLDPLFFFRINRKVLISHAAIVNMHQYPKSRIIIDLKPAMKDERDGIVSVERCERFKIWLNK